MRKLSIVGLCLTVGIAASAQMNVVKDIESKIKGGNADYVKALEDIQPALTNPESKDNAQTWFVAGKAGFEGYDNLSAKRALGQAVDPQTLSKTILSGYEYMMNVLPLDSIVDDKGKVKTKYSKDAIKTIVNHYNDFYNAGVMAWEGKDFKGAYDLWGISASLPTDARLGKNAPKAPADSVLGEIVYNRALAAWNMNELEKALNCFDQAKKHGYKKKNLYDYAISLAVQTKNNDLVFALAEEAYPLYGNEDPKFLQLMINSRIQKKEYDEARKMLDEAIATNPDNPQYYNLMGMLDEEQQQMDEAMAMYRKSVEKDPKYAHAQYNVGRMLCEKAYKLSDSASNLSQAQYNKLVADEINPLFQEAAKCLETAYELDPDNMRDALRYLRNVYYNLKDEDNLHRIEAL